MGNFDNKQSTNFVAILPFGKNCNFPILKSCNESWAVKKISDYLDENEMRMKMKNGILFLDHCKKRNGQTFCEKWEILCT